MANSLVPEHELLPGTRRALLHRLAAEQAAGRVPSVTAAIVRAGRMIWCGGRGMAEGQDPDSDTQYRIGSISKTLVAIMVMRLRDEGLVDLADPLAKHLDVPPVADVTVAQLLSHTSGLVSESGGPWWERTAGDLRPELADILPGRPRVHPAGRVFHYSNPGYALLGALITKLRGGRPWDEVVRAEVLAPLGLTRTTLDPQPPCVRGWAVHPWADLLQPEPTEHTGLMAPAGQYWSTAADMCRLAAFLADGNPQVLVAATLAEMRVPASAPDDDRWSRGYGLGVQLLRKDSEVVYGHTGSMPGFVSALCVSPDHGLAGVALANATSGADTVAVALDMIAIVAEREPDLPARWQPLPAVDQDLLGLTGLWYWGPRAYVLRLLPGRGLTLAPDGSHGRRSRFRAEADGTWTGLDGYYTGETLRVVRGEDGAAGHINLATFVFTREPYPANAPLAARPDPAGWQPAPPA
jgi:CubicO group peptidase (beta-lactamase class C family)